MKPVPKPKPISSTSRLTQPRKKQVSCSIEREDEEAECTFKPEINKLSSQMCSQLPFEQRMELQVNRYANRHHIHEPGSYSFRPEIDDRSAAMAGNKGDVFKRLAASPATPKDMSRNLFVPHVDSISSAIDEKKRREQGSKQPRW